LATLAGSVAMAKNEISKGRIVQVASIRLQKDGSIQDSELLRYLYPYNDSFAHTDASFLYRSKEQEHNTITQLPTQRILTTRTPSTYKEGRNYLKS